MYHNTKLPPTIKKLRRQFIQKVADVIWWLEENGFVTEYHNSIDEVGTPEDLNEFYLSAQTSFNIQVRHENDYIEVGMPDEDPKGEKFVIITPFEIDIKLDHSEHLGGYISRLEQFADQKLPGQKEHLSNISLDFEKRDFEFKLCGKHLKGTLTFEVYHEWR